MAANIGALPWNIIESAINRALALDPGTLAKLARLAGKTIRIESTAPVFSFAIAPHAEGVRLIPDHDTADVTLRAGTMTFLKLARSGEDMDALRGLEIDGDLGLGQQFQRIAQGFDIDWEEQLSRIVGDVAAYQLARAVRGGAAFIQNAGAALARDLGEYAQYESGLLASRIEVDAFLKAVDELRAGVDRLGARIALLRNR